jgi:hypothetical protein
MRFSFCFIVYDPKKGKRTQKEKKKKSNHGFFVENAKKTKKRKSLLFAGVNIRKTYTDSANESSCDSPVLEGGRE